MSTPPTSRRLPAAERRTRTLIVRTTEAEGDLVDQVAQRLGVSLSDLIRTAVLAYARERATA